MALRKEKNKVLTRGDTLKFGRFFGKAGKTFKLRSAPFFYNYSVFTKEIYFAAAAYFCPGFNKMNLSAPSSCLTDLKNSQDIQETDF